MKNNQYIRKNSNQITAMQKKKELKKSGAGYDKVDLFPYYDIIDGA